MSASPKPRAREDARGGAASCGVYVIATAGVVIRAMPAEVDLIQRLQRGDAAALREIYDLFSSGLYALLVRMLGSAAEAEEQLQEVFLVLWREAARFDPTRGSLRAWLYTMARRRALDLLRARQSRPHLGAQEDASALPAQQASEGSPEQEASEGERARALSSALATLPQKQRQVLELAYFQGLSQYEIAARLQVPVGTIKSRVRDAMIRLRGPLSRFGES